MFNDYVKTLRQSVQELTWSAAVVATEAAVLLGSKVATASADKKLANTIDEIMKNVSELQTEIDSVFGNRPSPRAANQPSSNDLPDQDINPPTPRR